jgi:hypothetical protein
MFVAWGGVNLNGSCVLALSFDALFRKFFIHVVEKNKGEGCCVGVQQVQHRPTAAYVLSLIGGIIGLVVGFVLIVVAAVISAASASDTYLGSIAAVVSSAIGVWSLISGAIVVVGAVKLNSNPWEHTKWGVIVLVFSVIGMGTVLGLIGGILALVYNPQGAVASQLPLQAITRICPKCG